MEILRRKLRTFFFFFSLCCKIFYLLNLGSSLNLPGHFNSTLFYLNWCHPLHKRNYRFCFRKCSGLFCHHFCITSSLLMFSFLLFWLSSFTFSLLQVLSSCWISVSIYFPSDTLTWVFFMLNLILLLPVYISDPSRILCFTIKQTCSWALWKTRSCICRFIFIESWWKLHLEGGLYYI